MYSVGKGVFALIAPRGAPAYKRLSGPKGLKKRSPPRLAHGTYSPAIRELSRVIGPDLFQFFRDSIQGLVPAYLNPLGIYPTAFFRVRSFEGAFNPVRVIDLLNHTERFRTEAALVFYLVLIVLQLGVGFNTHGHPIDPVYPQKTGCVRAL